MPYKAKGKTFLNDHPEEFGSIAWKVKVGGGIFDTAKVIHSELRVADCYKSIDLDFYCKSQKDLTKRIDKLNTMILELLEMKQCLMKAGEHIKPAKVY